MPRVRYRKSKREQRETKIASAARKQIKRGRARSAKSRFR